MVEKRNQKERCPRCGKGTLVTDANTGENFFLISFFNHFYEFSIF